MSYFRIYLLYIFKRSSGFNFTQTHVPVAMKLNHGDKDSLIRFKSRRSKSEVREELQPVH